MLDDVVYMARAVRLGMEGRGVVEPNPMVGCVIVKSGRMIGEGWHRKFGGAHAEVEALLACGESAAGATAYVTLEPCCHTNKKTPPCVPRLIEAGIGRVVVGAVDPNPEVSGRGIERLRAAGVEVVSGVMEGECKQLAVVFTARMRRERPYVTLKWAQSADGKVAGAGGEPVQISGPAASAAVHRLRAACDSILVGAGTVLADNPRLTARGVDAARQPTRFVIDRELRIPVDARVLDDDGGPRTTVFSAFSREPAYRRKRDALEEREIGITNVGVGSDGHLVLKDVLAGIAGMFSFDLLVEAGPRLAAGFFESGLVDRVWVIRSAKTVGVNDSPGAPTVPGHYVVTGRVEIEGDVLSEYLNPASSLFFAPAASADLVREMERASKG